MSYIRQSHSKISHLVSRSCVVLVAVLLTLSLHAKPFIGSQGAHMRPVEVASTSPFWLDPPPISRGSMLQRRDARPAVPVRAVIGSMNRKNAVFGGTLTAEVKQAEPVTVSVSGQASWLQGVHPSQSKSHHALVHHSRIRSSPSQTDQEFARTFSDSEKALSSVSSPMQDVHQDASAPSRPLVPDSAFASQQSGDTHVSTGNISPPVQLGAMTVKTEALVEHSEPRAAMELDSRYDAVKVRTSVTVPTFHHPLRLSVGGGYEHLVQPTAGRSSATLDTPPGTNDEVGTAGTSSAPALNESSRLDLQRTGYIATANLPVNEHLNVGVGYSQHEVRGGAGLAQGTPIDEHQELYTGSVTYAPGDGRSSLSIVGRASHAIDALAPVDATVKRGDILFSVKF